MMQDIDISELKKITNLVKEKSGYDFSDYAMSSFKRRMLRILELQGLSIDALLNKISHQQDFIQSFLDEVTVNTTECFRDPAFWRLLRNDVVPAVNPGTKLLNVLHAGCSSGEEVLSMTILLTELGLLDQVKLIATDIDPHILDKAKRATYPLKNMELNKKNYLRFEGKHNFSDYYEEKNEYAVFNPDLLKNVTFKKFDLVTGDAFGKFDIILCRNVMIYFNQNLQNRVLKKFHESLNKHGYLAIGTKESIDWSDIASRFAVVNLEEKIYQKVRD